MPCRHRIAVLCSGGGTNLQALIDDGIQIDLVVASAPKAYALERARNSGIKTIVLRKRDFPEPGAYEAAVAGVLNEHAIDLTVFAGWLVIMNKNFFELYTNKAINIHPSLLPAFGGKGFYGIKVHEAVLNANAGVTGASVHYVNREVDAGPVIMQKQVPVLDTDTPESLQLRVMEQAERVILPKAVRLLTKESV